MKIGFIGLGNVGAKLANSLLRNKFDLTVLDIDNNILDQFKKYGAKMGIHYTYKSIRGEKAMKKEAKRKARLEQRRAKKGVKEEKNEPEKMHDIEKTITLEDLTNPNKNQF